MTASREPPGNDTRQGLSEETQLQIDAYGLKVRTTRGFEDGGEQPRNWPEVWVRVKHHLRRICVDLPGGIADTLAAARSVVQGVGGFAKGTGKVPDAIATRVGRAHAIVDTIEDQKQQAAMESQLGKALPELSSALSGETRLREKLAELRARGFCVSLREEEDGSWALVIAPLDMDQHP